MLNKEGVLEVGEISKLILDSLYDGVLIIDIDGNVRYVNPAYTRITGVSYKEIVGNPLQDVRPGARLQSVLETGEKILRARRMEDGVEYVVNMSPVTDGQKIIGGISLVKAIDDAYELTKALSHYKKEIQSMRNRFNTIQSAKYSFDDIIAMDSAGIKMKELAKKVASGDITVLLSGESGTGKELYAQAIHNNSNRKEGPFIAVNCAAINPTLLESELFGYIEGAFTGAIKGGKTGLFEAAHNGTIFLDEISEMEYSLQSKLLRTLQENTVRRIGAVEEVEIDVRVIVASNKDLDKMVAEGHFREDFYYRIAVFPIELLPLRKRRGDIMPIAKALLKKKENALRRRIDMEDNAIAMLEHYHWPGNIRELTNTIEFACNMMSDYKIEDIHLPARIRTSYLKEKGMEEPMETLSELVKRTEQKAIIEAMQIYGDDIEGKKKTAKVLGISLATLYNKLKA